MRKRANSDSRQSHEHWAAVADAAHSQAGAEGGERAKRSGARGKTPIGGVKLHPGWDAAFKRARAR